MAVSSRQNQNMMNLIRKVHGLVERPDLTKHRQSQDRIGRDPRYGKGNCL